MTDQDILTDLQNALMEPPDNGATWPSDLWEKAEVLARMNERQNRFLKAALLHVGMASIPIAANVSTVALPQDWLVTQDVVWTGTASQTVRSLVRADQFQADHAHPDWTITGGVPLVYFDHDQPLLELRIAPTPLEAGTLLLFYIPQGDEVDGSGMLLSVADEFADSAVKFGALADLLLKEGRGRSPDRAGYAESRFALGVEVADLILRSVWVG